MFPINLKYELKLLLRSRWIQLLSLLSVTLIGYAVYNGQNNLNKRVQAISDAQLSVEESDRDMLKLLDSVEKGMSVSASRWTIPSSPAAVGNYHPRVAAMEAQALGFISTGQSDLFTHYVKPTLSGDDFALNFTEMTSPVQLLFGSFDLAFVIVYLLPLIVIAFSYNILSAQRESGSLRLLASQPIGIRVWVLQKLGIRFALLSGILLVFLSIVFMIFHVPVQDYLGELLSLFGIILAYLLFWFALAFLVNLGVGNSGRNAVSLLVLWVVFVLLTPSVLNQLGSTLYPMPSRTKMINEMRSLKAELNEKQDEILDNYLRDHPEYAINDSTVSRNFYHRYMASQDLLKKELAPLVNSYEDQLQKQQEWVDQLKWLSPSLIVQESLNNLSGTSTNHYEDYRRQVINFAEEWRKHLLPFLYNNINFSTQDYDELPQFKYISLERPLSSLMLYLWLLSLLLFGVGFMLSARTSDSRILNHS